MHHLCLIAVLVIAVLATVSDARGCGCDRCHEDKTPCPVRPKPDVITFNGQPPDVSSVFGYSWTTSEGTVAMPAGTAGGCTFGFCPNLLQVGGNNEYLTDRVLDARAWTAARSGTLSHLRVNVLYGVSSNSTALTPLERFGNVTVTVWTASPSQSYTATPLSVTGDLLVPFPPGHIGTPSFVTLDLDLSDATHSWSIFAGTRVSVLVVFRNASPPFNTNNGTFVQAAVWISGSYEFA